ncbi:MAG: hypothetical protein WKF58_02995 [Ilumatobacteraceae bacterium]
MPVPLGAVPLAAVPLADALPEPDAEPEPVPLALALGFEWADRAAVVGRLVVAAPGGEQRGQGCEHCHGLRGPPST